MKIVADQNIPCVAEAFSGLGTVELIPGREIRSQHLRDCQCLITRTVTPVNEALLGNSAVEFVATATIGTDHIDLDYLDKNGIGFSNAAGCNAEAVAEIVIGGLFALSKKRGFDPFQLRAGIVGFGNTGSRLYQKLEALGIECLVCDPPLQLSGQSQQSFVTLETIVNECNCISLHVPLQHDGDHPTFHLFDRTRLQQLVEGCILVNAARGEIIDNPALLALLKRREDLTVYLDTWENEPLILRELMQRVDLATPHIAGYSVEGRLRGTQMVLDAACAHFGRTSSWQMSAQLPASKPIQINKPGPSLALWQELFQKHWDIHQDHADLVAGISLDDAAFATHFDGLRRNYPERLEYEQCQITEAIDNDKVTILRGLGFRVSNSKSGH